MCESYIQYVLLTSEALKLTLNVLQSLDLEKKEPCQMTLLRALGPMVNSDSNRVKVYSAVITG